MKDPDPTIAHSILRGQICASKSARADQMGCSAAFSLPKITLHVTKQEDLKGSSRPNRLFGDSWSAENHFARNKTGGFARLEQTKWAIFLHLVCFFAKKATESRRSAHKKTPHSQGAGRISRVFAKSATKQPSRLRRPWRMLPDRRRPYRREPCGSSGCWPWKACK